MWTEKISEKIYYIGVNDRTTQLFESLWTLPFGVSYNSYLAIGSEKAAIIDGVEASRAENQINAIRNILGDRQPDYIIINHMEPDHSGGISALRAAFPDIKIVGNQQTLNMVKGFYGLDENTLVVKDGDILTLGEDDSLQFFTTPMVHWPETMMTWFSSQSTLFSGDAFGCFGALNGVALDTEMATDRYLPEMVRYYSNIVGKYGAFVQKSLKKLSSLPVKTVCSTHGPIWREKAGEVISLYDRLSLYSPLDNGATIVFGSMYGNSARVAEAVAHGLATAGIRDIEMFNSVNSNLSFMLEAAFRHKGLVIVAPTYSDSLFPPVRNFVEAIAARGLKNREVLVLGGHTWAERASGIISGILENASIIDHAEKLIWKHAPTADFLHTAEEAGRNLAAKLNSNPLQ